MANVVIVADMIRGFLEEGYPLYLGQKAREIIPNVRRMLEEEKRKGSHIIFLADNHEPDDREFEMFPPHCVKGTVETEVIPELADLATEVIPKTRYSAFYGTNLEERIRELSPDKIVMCGVCTDICVLHTIADAPQPRLPRGGAGRLRRHVRRRGACLRAETHREGARRESGLARRESRRARSARKHVGQTRPANPALGPQRRHRRYLLPAHARGNGARGAEPAREHGVLPCPRRPPLRHAGSHRAAQAASSRPTPRSGASKRARRCRARRRSFASPRPTSRTASTRRRSPASWRRRAAGRRRRASASMPRKACRSSALAPATSTPTSSAAMDYAAVVGGCLSCSSRRRRAARGTSTAAGTMPHALIICFGDTVAAALAFDKHLPPDVPRTVLVDTFHDEAEESLRVAEAMRERLQGVRLDTPGERGGVTPDLVKEVRARLDLAGFPQVQIFVSGGVTPERIVRNAPGGRPRRRIRHRQLHHQRAAYRLHRRHPRDRRPSRREARPDARPHSQSAFETPPVALTRRIHYHTSLSSRPRGVAGDSKGARKPTPSDSNPRVRTPCSPKQGAYGVRSGLATFVLALSLAVSSALMSGPPARGSADVLLDEGFEDGIDGWVTDGGELITTSAISHQGAHSAVFSDERRRVNRLHPIPADSRPAGGHLLAERVLLQRRPACRVGYASHAVGRRERASIDWTCRPVTLVRRRARLEIAHHRRAVAARTPPSP